MEQITDFNSLHLELEKLAERIGDYDRSNLINNQRYFWQTFINEANVMPFIYGSGELAIHYRSKKRELQLFDQGKLVVNERSASVFDDQVRVYLHQRLELFNRLSSQEKCRQILKRSGINVAFTKKGHSYMVTPTEWLLTEQAAFDTVFEILVKQSRIVLRQYLPYQFFLVIGYERQEFLDKAPYCYYPQNMWKKHQEMAQALNFSAQNRLMDKMIGKMTLSEEWQPFTASFYKMMPLVQIKKHEEEGISFIEFWVKGKTYSPRTEIDIYLVYNLTFHHIEQKRGYREKQLFTENPRRNQRKLKSFEESKSIGAAQNSSSMKRLLDKLFHLFKRGDLTK